MKWNIQLKHSSYAAYNHIYQDSVNDSGKMMIIKLRNLLDEKGKSIYWLNKETGIASSALSRICNNKTSSIDFSVLDKICEALNCNVSDILVHESSSKKFKGDTTQQYRL